MIFQAKKIAKTSLMAAAILVAASFSASCVFAAEPVVYKVIDSQGRVTYANTPLKGGVKVELEPLTVIPSSPSGYLQTGVRTPQAPAVALIPVSDAIAEPVPVNLTAPAAATRPVALVVAAPSIAPPLAPPAAAPAPVPVAAPTAASVASPLVANNIIGSFQKASMETISQARREELRPAIQDEQLRQTEKLLANSKAELEKVQDRNDEMRALRVTHATPAELAAGSKKPPMTPEIRQHIERHYERIRELQDEIAMHENNLQALRSGPGSGSGAAQVSSN